MNSCLSYDINDKLILSNDAVNILMNKIKIPENKNKCWEWIGTIGKSGYSKVYLGKGFSERAHRIMYEYLISRIPDERQIDHLCKNKICVNPNHLKIVTAQENIDRRIHNNQNMDKTHCKRGHEFTLNNFYIIKLKNGKTGRSCKKCIKLRNQGLI